MVKDGKITRTHTGIRISKESFTLCEDCAINNNLAAAYRDSTVCIISDLAEDYDNCQCCGKNAREPGACLREVNFRFVDRKNKLWFIQEGYLFHGNTSFAEC